MAHNPKTGDYPSQRFITVFFAVIQLTPVTIQLGQGEHLADALCHQHRVFVAIGWLIIFLKVEPQQW